jgi:hypothetical protein
VAPGRAVIGTPAEGERLVHRPGVVDRTDVLELPPDLFLDGQVEDG